MVSVRKPSLTKRQREVLRAIDRLTAKRGKPPSFRELANQLGISSINGIQCHLRSLRSKGLVDWDEGRSRTLRRATPAAGIPILGTVA